VKQKSTDELNKELVAAPDLNRFLSKNKENFENLEFSQVLTDMFQRSGMSKAVLAKSAGISEVYLYQLFSGARTPSRDRVLCLCIAMKSPLEETQDLLKSNSFAPLYAKNRRDAIIMYGMAHRMSLEEINDKLFAENEATLY